MKKIIVTLFLSVNCLFSYNLFNPIGFKATGMGGVGTANAPASLASYYNPALLLASPNSTEFSIGVGLTYRENNIARNLDTLENAQLEDTIDNIEEAASGVVTGFTFNTSTITDAITSILNSGDTLDTATLTETFSTLIENEVITQTTLDDLVSGGYITNDVLDQLKNEGLVDSSGNLITKSAVSSRAATYDINSLLSGLTVTLNVSAEDRENIKKIQDVISNLSSNNALYFSVDAYVSSLVDKNFAIGVFMYVDAAIKIKTSASHTELIVKNDDQYVKYNPDTDQVSFTDENEYKQSSIMYAIDSGLIGVDAKAMWLTEIPLTFSDTSQYLNGYLGYGLNVKLMNLTMKTKSISLQSGSDAVEDLTEDNDFEFNTNVGLDLGVAYQPRDSGTIIGLVGKNLNSPTFKIDGETIKLKPAYRIGVSRQFLFDTAEFAIDYDLTENDTLIAGETTQKIGTGIEFHPASWFSFRVGAMKDIGDNSFNDGYIYTAGLGFGLKWGQFDISAMKAENDGYYDGEDIPKYMKVNIAFVSKWGGR